MKRLCTFILALLFTISLSAQQMAKGIVYDDSGSPVGGVLVSVDGDNSTYTLTDSNGFFEISANKGTVLNFSCLGLLPKQIKIDGFGSSLSIIMDTDTQMLEETVVVGYGVTKKRDLAGSVSQIKAEDVKAGVITSTALKPPTPHAHIAASAPPLTMTFALPSLIRLNASARALLDDAHALVVV